MDEVANLVAGVVEFIVGVPNLADEVAGPASRVVALVGEVPNLVQAAAGLVAGVGEFRGGVADLVAGATAEYSARMSGFRGGGMSGLKNVRNRRNDSLSRVRWDQFESLLAVYFRGQGYEVDHCGTGGADTRFDGGIDLRLRRPGEYVLVQCKHWNAKQVPHNEVHQLLGLMLNEDATSAILVTSGEFTTAARQAATRLGRVRLVDGEELRVMLGPLPEPQADRMEDVLRGFAGTVVRSGLSDQVMSAVGARVGGHVRREAGRAVKGALVTLGLKLLAGAVLLAVVLVVFNNMRASLQSQLTRPTPRPSAITAAPIAATPDASKPVAATRDECREVIDAPSGTYINHCASGAAPTVPTEAERRALARKADEAMKLIEASTPEM